MIETTTYARKPFEVEAVLITEENFDDVAEWCSGDVFIAGEDIRSMTVKVFRPMSPKQTVARVGDWVLKTGSGFKIYTDKAFNECFERA